MAEYNAKRNAKTQLPPLPPLNPFLDSRVSVPLLFHILLHRVSAHIFFPSTPFSKLTSAQHLLAEKIPSTLNALLVSLPSLSLFFPQTFSSIFGTFGSTAKEKQDGSEMPWAKDWVTPYPELIDRVFAAHWAFTLYDLYIMCVFNIKKTFSKFVKYGC
jgi:hypothetical protein